MEDLKKIEEADKTGATRNSAPSTPCRSINNDYQRQNIIQEEKTMPPWNKLLSNFNFDNIDTRITGSN